MTGDSIIWGAMGTLVLIAVAAHSLRLLRSRITPAVESWPGRMVAVVVQQAEGSFTAAVTIQRTDQPLEATLFVGGAEQLPQNVQAQVFRSTLGAAGPTYELNLPAEDLPDAVAQARHGGYRFVLPFPVPVEVFRNSRGQLDWQLHRGTYPTS